MLWLGCQAKEAIRKIPVACKEELSMLPCMGAYKENQLSRCFRYRGFATLAAGGWFFMHFDHREHVFFLSAFSVIIESIFIWLLSQIYDLPAGFVAPAPGGCWRCLLAPLGLYIVR